MWKVLNVGGCIVGGLLLLVVAYLGVLLYPGVLFANQVEYKNFTVHSQEDIGDGIETILDDIEAAIVTSEIYDPALEHDIFFGHGNTAFRITQDIRWWIISRVIGLAPALTYNASVPPRFNHVVTFRIPDMENNALLHPEHLRPINMTRLLTHEVVHTLTTSRIGLDRIPRIPVWKQEGYGDYIAASTSILADPSYSLRESVERILSLDLSWMQDDDGNYTPMRYGCQSVGGSIEIEAGHRGLACYYVGRVLLEYLFDVKGLSFDEVFAPEVRDTDTLYELIAAYESGSLDV
jgi:hypothetical protein